jgi:hypothetical protein
MCEQFPGVRGFDDQPFQVNYSGGRSHGKWDTLLRGFVDPRLKHVARLELTSPRGVTPVPYRDHVFMLEMPGGSPGELPGPGPYTLTAYDAAGHAVARHRLRLPGQSP